MTFASFTEKVAVDHHCPRWDCKGSTGHVTYVNGEQRTTLPVIQGCTALRAFCDFGDDEHCPLTQGEP